MIKFKVLFVFSVFLIIEHVYKVFFRYKIFIFMTYQNFTITIYNIKIKSTRIIYMFSVCFNRFTVRAIESKVDGKLDRINIKFIC